MIRIAPSILSADFARLGEQVAIVTEAGADWLHVDVMDGRFVPNITIGPPVVKALRRVTDRPLDVHLMIVEPARYVAAFAEAGADRITVHVEADPHLDRTMTVIRDHGCRAGVSLNPATPIGSLEEVAGRVDQILLMSVNPGFGGQAFLPTSLARLDRLVALRQRQGGKFLIEIDGGIDPNTAPEAVAHGAQVLVAGSAVFGREDPAAALKQLVAAARRGLNPRRSTPRPE